MEISWAGGSEAEHLRAVRLQRWETKELAPDKGPWETPPSAMETLEASAGDEYDPPSSAEEFNPPSPLEEFSPVADELLHHAQPGGPRRGRLPFHGRRGRRR